MTTTDPGTLPAGQATDYVLLRKVDSPEFIMALATTSEEEQQLKALGPLVQRLIDSVTVWRELGVVSAADRPTAWENAKRDYALDMPQEIGSQGHAQLVPTRFWRTITAVVEQPPPQLRTEGL